MQQLDEAFLAEQFPQDPELCYLNHAAVSPWPKCAGEALTHFAAENVKFGATHYPVWMKTENALRERLAALLQIDTVHEIALAKSTSEALSTIAYGLDWNDGDEVIMSNQEFPSNRIVWESLASQGVRVRVANIDQGDPVAAVSACLSDRTRLVSISSVQYATGLRINLASLGAQCRARNVLFCVDAIQSLGALAFNQKEIQADFIVADGHKWMMAAEGLALLYVKSDHLDTLKLHQFGWHMVAQRGNYDRQEWEPAQDATRFECGSPNMLGACVLNASLGLLLDLGMDRIEAALQSKMQYLTERLLAIPDLRILTTLDAGQRAGILTFIPPVKDLTDLYKKLMKNKVICAHRGGGIRFSPAFYTPLETIDRAVDRLENLL